MALFHPFQVRVDPWQVDYGAETPLMPLEEEAEGTVDPNVEVLAGEWKPIRPEPVSSPRRVCFVDGVRRLESRLQVRRNGSYLHGAFGSYAVGCVEVRDQAATFGKMEPGRLLVYGSGQKPEKAVPVRNNLTYQPQAAAGDEPEAPLSRVQESMRQAEGQLTRDLVAEEETLVIADGPLNFESTGGGLAVGFIKRITKLYLPSALLPMVVRLPPGNRTPLFAIRTKLSRYAWFMRLAAVRPAESDFHGLVRLEVHEGLGKEKAQELADLTAAMLPRFAPPRARDPRSPQNLLPVSALEGRLRRELGDALLIRRWIEEVVSKEVASA